MMSTSLNLSSSTTLGGSLLSLSLRCERTFQCYSTFITIKKLELNQRMRSKFPIILCCSEPNTSTVSSSEATMGAAQSPTSTAEVNTLAPKKKRRARYRKQYPGEKQGITEEMRFVAMKLHNTKAKIDSKKSGRENDGVDDSDRQSDDDSDESVSSSLAGEDAANSGETWEPSMEGFLKYLVDSKLVFDTIEGIVDECRDISYAYFRNTGLERSKCFSKDLEWFRQQDIAIPEPSNPGVTYANYLEELAAKSPPLFLCHFYNIYFSHIAGGQVIGKQVSERLLEGREMEFYSWEGDAAEMLRGVRAKLNMIGEHWSRDEKNRCLREATKSFRYLGQIVRLIIII
ncbi:hypothetical protein LguiB_019997 [Lonicera macranthoides]